MHTHTPPHVLCFHACASDLPTHTHPPHPRARARAFVRTRLSEASAPNRALRADWRMGGGQRTSSGSSPPSAAQSPAAKSAVITRRRSSLASHAATRRPERLYTPSRRGTPHGAAPHIIARCQRPPRAHALRSVKRARHGPARNRSPARRRGGTGPRPVALARAEPRPLEAPNAIRARAPYSIRVGEHASARAFVFVCARTQTRHGLPRGAESHATRSGGRATRRHLYG
jgi:hypothetical protein